MSAITYTAKRSLISGHTSGVDYSIDVVLEAADRGAASEFSSARALGGAQETILQKLSVNWSIVIGSIQASEIDAVREFLDSVQGGETYSLDIEGTVAVPVNPVDMISEPNYDERRVNNSSLRSVSFKARQI